MAGHPRMVLTDTYVTWDGETEFVRKGTIADIQPGSQLEIAYGGPSNLSAAITTGDPENADKSELAN